MKIPIDRIDLGTLGYSEYWLEVPRSVKEGFLHTFSQSGAKADEDSTPESARETNIKIMELVLAWNIDDDNGKILPLISKCKTKAEKERVIAELPVDVIVHVAQRIAGNVTIPEATKTF